MSAIIAPIVISSVNTGTDEITCTAPHGLLTGDPFLVVYSPDGGTLPAPLAPVTHYWAIRQSDTVVKLAASSSDAMAGTAINLTSAGTGTRQILRGSPYTIPAIYVPFTQLNPDHVQAALESIEAIWGLLTGQAESVWSGVVKLAGNLTLGADLKHGDRTRTLPGCAAPPTTSWTVTSGHLLSTGSGNATLAIPLMVGDATSIFGDTLLATLATAPASSATPPVFRSDDPGSM